MSDKGTSNKVPVLDSDNRFLSNTTPAKARMMLKNGRATVFNDNPFMIKQSGELKNTMIKRKPVENFITNFTKHFSKEEEVYIQNLGSTNISLSFKYEGEDLFVSIPKTRKPLNLTQYVPFDSIKNSPTFRGMINRNPPILRLLKEKEYLEYYDKISARYGTDPVDEMRIAQDIFSALMGKRKPSTDALRKEMEDKMTEKEEALLNAKEPNSKVIGLCSQADKDYGPGRLTGRDLIEELEVFERDFGVEDWEYIASKGVYKEVKKYAMSMLEKLTSSDDADEE